MLRFSLTILLLAAGFRTVSLGFDEPPKSWIDPDTGHRIVRLTNEPDSASLYFNQNGYTADGKKMVYTTPEGISALNLETHAARPVVKGRVRVIVIAEQELPKPPPRLITFGMYPGDISTFEDFKDAEWRGEAEWGDGNGP